MAYKYMVFIRDGRPSVTGIRDGLPPAWFSKEIWNRNLELQKLIQGSDVSKYMAGIQPNYEIKMDGIELDAPAKLTDFLFVGGLLIGFLVNGKARNILKDFNLPDHTFYPVICRQFNRKTKETKEIHDYQWLYFERETGEKNINFAESEFYYLRKYLDYEPVIKTYEDYMQIAATVGIAMSAKKLVFNASFDTTLDLWGIRYGSNYISSNLYKTLMKEKISGFTIATPACKLLFS